MRILAIIPAYNEEMNVANTVSNLASTCPDVDYLVVNDGSSDNTGLVCAQNGIRHVDLPINTGLASGFQLGMKFAERNGYDAAVQFDADGQHLPEFILPMAEAMVEQNASVVIASRVLAGEGPKGARGLGSHLISGLIRLTTGKHLTDPTSGMRMYDRELIHEFAHGFDIAPEPDTIAMLARKSHKIVEIPAHMEERQGGESYLNLPSIIRYMSRTCFSILMFQWFR